MTTETLKVDEERAKFEAWFKREFHPDKSGPYLKDMLRDCWLARALLETSPTTPPGWKLVPVNPTPEMLRPVVIQLASITPGRDEYDRSGKNEGLVRWVYRVMLRNAPETSS